MKKIIQMETEKHIQEILKKNLDLPEISLREVLESYSHIDLTEDEMLEAMIWRKQKKADEIKEAEVKKRETENRRQLTETQWSFKQTEPFMLYRANKIFEGKFKIDDDNRVVFNLL